MILKENVQYDVTAMGELLVDFTRNGLSPQGNWMLEANPGGAPCNVLAMLSRLGHKTAFIGKVGNDMFGTMLKERVDSLGIDTTNLCMSDTYKTTLAFVRTAPDGDRSFSFYRNPGADAALEKSEIRPELISSSAVLHFGTLSMTNEPANTATEYALETAKKEGTILSFDPNLRPLLWDSEAHAKERIRYGLSLCDILKIAEEELYFVTGETEVEAGIRKLRGQYHIPLITVTMGKKGAYAFYDDGKTMLTSRCPTFTSVKTVDTTGAGDTFGACILHDILKHGLTDFTKDRLHRMLVYANAAASLVTSRKGALSVMPAEEEIQNLIGI